MTKKYQLLFIIKDGLSEDVTEGLITRYSDLIESLGGAVTLVDKWGTRKFAYEINHMTQGYYVLFNFESKPEVPAEVDRQMRINDKIIRQMITLL